MDEISRLIAALHDHGVPTWQDLTNLDEEPLEDALRATLADPQRRCCIWPKDVPGGQRSGAVSLPER